VQGGDGSLVIVDTNEGMVRRFSTSGKLLSTIRVAEGSESWYPPLPIATDRAGNIYAAPRSRSDKAPVIEKYSPDGRLVWQYPFETGSTGDFDNYIAALAVDYLDRLWVWVGEGGPSLFTVNPQRGFEAKEVRQVPYTGYADIETAAFDANGNRYELRFQTAAGYGTDLLKLDPQGKLLWSVNWVAVEGTGLALGRRGRVYVTFQDFKFTAPVCVEVTADGKLTGALGSNGTGLGEVREPSGLAVDAAGDLYVGDYYNYRIQRFSADGQFLGKILGPEPPADKTQEARMESADLYGPPCAIAIGPRGTLYVTHTAPEGLGQTITALSTRGKIIQNYPSLDLGYGGYTSTHFGSSPRFPAGVAVDSKGHIWAAIVLEWQTSDTKDPKTGRYAIEGGGVRVVKLDRNGGRLLSLGGYGTSPGKFGRLEVEGIGTALLAVDKDDDVWVVDPGNNRVQQFDPKGRYLGQIGGETGQFSGFRIPWGVAISAQGDLYVADATRIQRFDAKGRFLAIAAHIADQPPSVVEPYDLWPYRGLAVDSHGNLYITDASTDSVRKFVPRCVP
jgi:sugar lactone lactonase YvrE